jgi:hypothetical protein
MKNSHFFWIVILGGLLIACSSTQTRPQGSLTSLALVTGFNTSAPTLGKPRPALNRPFIDERYGTTISRVTDASQITDRDKPTWVRHEYSRKQAFNVDSSRALMLSSNGYARLYQVNNDTLTFLKTLNIAESQEPIWHPRSPHFLFLFGNYGDGMKMFRYNIRNDRLVMVRDFSARLKGIFGSSATRAWTKQEGRPSDDGKIWCLQVEDASFQALGLVAYDFVNDQIVGHLKTTDRPDHISTSPKGNYCVPSWVSSKGTRAYTLTFQSYSQLHTTSEHSDLAVTAAGQEVYVYTDYQTGDVAMRDLATGSRTNLFRLYGPNSSGTAVHLSGTAKNKPGWVLISFYACTQSYGAAPCDYRTQWFKDKVVAVELKANPVIYNLAHTRNGEAGYFSEPQATVNADFTKILFTSTWESNKESDVHDYMISLPVGSF